MKEQFGNESENVLEPQRIDVSGWDQNGQYFTEHSHPAMDFANGNNSHATLKLQRALGKKAIVFVSGFLTVSSSGVLHNPYCVVDAKPVAQGGGWEYRVIAMRPRKKEPNGHELASNFSEERERSPQPSRRSEGSGTEEVLHEA